MIVRQMTFARESLDSTMSLQSRNNSIGAACTIPYEPVEMNINARINLPKSRIK